ncbi:MAG: ATP-binding protein [Candidatus Anstonellales archaeon]
MIVKSVDDIFSTKDIQIPNDEFQKIIGQDNAIRLVKMAVRQRRHILLVGPPGIGKSMIGKAMASALPLPKEQISVQYNPKKPQRPILRIERRDGKNQFEYNLKPIPYEMIPDDVADKLGIRCKQCGGYSEPSKDICPYCLNKKSSSRNPTFMYKFDKKRNFITKNTILDNGDYVMEIYFVDEDKVYKYQKPKDNTPIPDAILSRIDIDNYDRKIIVPFDRPLFVQVVAKTESEMFGDVEHDPYGAHPDLGSPHHERVVPGAVHEAHEGILYIDELSTMEPNIQRGLLTAMQDKKFPIAAKNTHGTGAVVKVENVPCDFILVGAINVVDLDSIHPALRNRISGYGYEILLNTWMPINEENIYKTYQFVAQEIVNDGKIPHAHISALHEIIKVSKMIAKSYDDVNGLTLRLRYLGGIIRVAGDLAVLDEEEYILSRHVQEALKIAKPVESQIRSIVGNNWWRNLTIDYGNYVSDNRDVR